METNNLVRIFWTGGWDSTFRVLYLILVEKKIIQPYYIKAEGRASLHIEISVMEQIKEELFKQYPETKHLVKPTIFIEENKLGVNNNIRQSFLNLQKTNNIGYQYDYMARFANETEINGIEVCMQLHEYHLPEGPLANILVEGSTCIDHKYYNTDVYKVFGFFSFPILNISKLEMKKIATEFKFLNLLNKSWFCHHPIYGKPCGTCLPCMIVMEEKMYERMPFISKIRYYTSPKRYLKLFLRKNSKYNYRVKNFLGKAVK